MRRKRIVTLGILLFIAGCSGSTKPSVDQSVAVDVAEADGDATTTPETTEPDLQETVTPLGCQKEGDPCDDGDACTHTDKCDATLTCKGTSYTCDDGRECTDDQCDGNGFCLFTVKTGKCFINGICVDKGTIDPKNPCVECDPTVTATDWTPDDTNTCTDESVCTKNEKCVAGECVFTLENCDDGNPCTVNSCHPQKGCQTEKREGACEDGDLCNGTETCVDGVCTPAKTPTNCDDDNPCTTDTCDPDKGCINTPLTGGSCQVANKCVETGTCKDGDCDVGASGSCTKDSDCASGKLCYNSLCVTARKCEDGDICTENFCEPDSGCITGVVDPKDQPCCVGINPCTLNKDNACITDTCSVNDQGQKVCGTVLSSDKTACDDNNKCTINDICDGKGACKGTQKNCDDGNPCTTDACNPGNGECTHAPLNSGACDDGIACTTNTSCVNGKCVGDESNCGCTPNFSNTMALKMTSIQIGANGQFGEALNVDGLSSTCSPSTACSDGRDNVLSALGLFVNGELTKGVNNKTIVLLLAADKPLAKNTTFTLSVYQGTADPSNPNCNDAGNTCPYYVTDASLDSQTCQALVQLKNAKITSGKLNAGGASAQHSFILSIPFGSQTLTLSLAFAQIDATVSTTGSDSDLFLSSISGVLGGAVPKAQLVAAIQALPDEAFANLPLPKSAIVGIIQGIAADIDTTGNGTADAISIGIKFSGSASILTGVSKTN